MAEGDLNARLLAQADASLDVVVAFDVIEHFTRDELLPFVEAVHRVLKPGGRWIIHMPYGESPFFGSIRNGDLTHELAFTRTSLSQLLLSSDSSDVRCFVDTPMVHGAKSAVRWGLSQGFRGLLRALHRRRDWRYRRYRRRTHLFAKPAGCGGQMSCAR